MRGQNCDKCGDFYRTPECKCQVKPTQLDLFGTSTKTWNIQMTNFAKQLIQSLDRTCPIVDNNSKTSGEDTDEI